MQAKSDRITRRQALRNSAVAGLGLTGLSAAADGLVAQALAASPMHGTLKDIEHVVILIQENRSFDHYFGTMSGVRGFGDKLGHKHFFQKTLGGKTIQPFHLPKHCLPDISHDWGPQHHSWDGGKMDGFVRSREPASVNGSAIAPETMGYYTREDLSFYYALANAFTICDGYHCSVIGPTDPNRLMSMTATLDPAGKHGGPLVQTLVSTRAATAGHFTWTTMPERLSANGVSWKVYTDLSGGGVLDNVLPYFKAFRAGTKYDKLGLQPTYPADFIADLENNSLPKVSWLTAGVLESEHPGFSDRDQRRDRGAPGRGGVGLASGDVEEDGAVHHLGRERRVLRPCDPADPPEGDEGRVPDRLEAPVGGAGHPRPGRPRLPGADARRVPVRSRWARVLGYLRPHLDAALPRVTVRGGGAEPQPVAQERHRRPHERVQLRGQAAGRASRPAGAQCGRREVHRCRPRPGSEAAVPQAGEGDASQAKRDRP